MSYIFPSNPAIGDIAVGPNGATWLWDGTKWVGGMGGPYLPLDGGQMTGRLLLYADPTLDLEAATKEYVDRASPGPAPMDGRSYGRMLNTWNPVVPLTGAIMQGAINMNTWPLTGLRTPIVPTDAANKAYVDANGGGGGGGIPEAPTDGEIYGRDGQTGQWVPVLSTTAIIDGGQF